MSVGLNQFPISCECFLYGLMYIKAFEFESYRKVLREGTYAYISPLSAFLDIINPIDILRGTHIAFMGFKKPEHVTIDDANPKVTTNGALHHAVGGEETMEPKFGSESTV